MQSQTEENAGRTFRNRNFLVTADTIRSWLRRVDEQGPDALVQLAEPVNKFPEFVRYIVQQLKALCPMLGKAKIAQILARAGLHIGVTTVGRILTEKPAPKPTTSQQSNANHGVVTSKYPNHLWQMDLTVVPIGPGLWTTWQPFSLPQCWPFSWWLGIIMDHHSRRIMGITLFSREPTSEAMRAFLGRTIHATGVTPRHLVTDQGPQFACNEFEPWCRRKGIRPRFGAALIAGQHLRCLPKQLFVPVDHLFSQVAVGDLLFHHIVDDQFLRMLPVITRMSSIAFCDRDPGVSASTIAKMVKAPRC